MKKKETVKRGGGKLNRTETVTLRLDPRLRYLTDIAARTQRRTTSGYIEWAIEENLAKVVMPGNGVDTLADSQHDLWDINEADRVVKLAFLFPRLLNYEEQVLWKLVQESGYLWRGEYEKPSKRFFWVIKFRNLKIDRLREEWDKFKAVAAGDLEASELPTWDEFEPGTKE